MGINIKDYSRDLSYIVVIGLLPIWMLVFQHSYLLYGKYVTAIICTIFATGYLKKLGRYIKTTLLSIVFVSIILIGLLGKPAGLAILVLVIPIFYIALGAAIGFIIAYILNLLIERVSLNTPIKKPVAITAAIVISLSFLFLIVSFERNQDILSKEINKRSKLTRYIVQTIIGENNTYIDTNEVIQSRAMNDIYSINQGVLQHGYDGNIEIHTIKDTITVEYFNIPAGKPCYWFYYMNTPIGFKDITVNDISTKTDTSSQAEREKKNELCFSDDAPVVIRYKATFKDLKAGYEILASTYKWNKI